MKKFVWRKQRKIFLEAINFSHSSKLFFKVAVQIFVIMYMIYNYMYHWFTEFLIVFPPINFNPELQFVILYSWWYTFCTFFHSANQNRIVHLFSFKTVFCLPCTV